jgi:hypothetical protein
MDFVGYHSLLIIVKINIIDAQNVNLKLESRNLIYLIAEK